MGIFDFLSSSRNKNIDYFEDNLDSLCLCSFELEKRSVGGFLLEKNGRYRLNFGFESQGIHPSSDHDQISGALEGWNQGLVSIPTGEFLRIHQRSRPRNHHAVEMYETLAHKSDLPILQMLAFSQQKNIKQRTNQGLRSEYQIPIIATYSFSPNKDFAQDAIETTVSNLLNSYHSLNGQKRHQDQEFIKELLYQSFYAGYLSWEQVLSQRAKLPVQSFTAEALWHYIWSEFNSGPPPPIPHLLKVTGDRKSIQVEEIIIGERDLNSSLVAGENGIPSIPKISEQWNRHIGIHDEYVAAVVLENPLDGFKDDLHHFSFFWDTFSLLHNCEIVWEVQKANQQVEKFMMQRAVKNHKSSAKYSQKKGTINVDADNQIVENVEAQYKLIENKKICILSVTFFIYRSTVSDLDLACQKLINYFPEGKLMREIDSVEELWLQKLPIVMKHLVNPERRNKVLSDMVSMPVICPRSVDNNPSGFELTTIKGNKPIYIDYQNQHRGTLTIAETGMGKSTLAADKVVHNLLHNIPGVILDYGNIDGTTTFTCLAESLGDQGANIEAAQTKNNLIQTPNLNELPKNLQSQNILTFQSFVLNALETITLGNDRTSKQAKRVRALLKYLIPRYYQDPIIAQRYELGHLKGLGSDAWLKMPTLHDFIHHVEKLELKKLGEINIATEAKGEILWGLTTFVNSPLGQKLSSPSEINVNAKLVCFSIRGANDEDEAVILGLSAQSIAIRHALRFPKCYVLIDEGNILFQNEGLAISNAEFVVNGRKGGIFCNVLLQSISTLAKCSVGELFLDNLRVRLVGAIQSTAISHLSNFFDEKPETFYQNTHHDFLPNNLELNSHWLLMTGGKKYYVRHAPSPALLAMVATTGVERKARERYLETIPNRLKALTLFGNDYQLSKRNNSSFDDLDPRQYLSNHLVKP